jgi:hypothetical protein
LSLDRDIPQPNRQQSCRARPRKLKPAVGYIALIMADQSTRSYVGKVDILEGGVLKIKPDDKQYPLVLLSAAMWLQVEQEQREPATPLTETVR